MTRQPLCSMRVTTSHRTPSWCGAVIVAVVLVGTALAQSPPVTDAVQAQRRLAAGLDFLKAGQRHQAEQEFKSVIEIYPDTPAWDAAVLKLSEVYFEAGDLAQARAQVERLTGDRRSLPSTPMARVLLGRILLEQRRDPKRLDDAVSEFKRVRQYHPGNAAIAAARYFEAEAHRLARNYPLALSAYRDVSTSYPRTPWAARALLGEARCLARVGRGASAIEPLQQVRDRFASLPEATRATQWSTILYRLFLKGATPYGTAPLSIPAAPAKLKDVTAMLFAEDGVLYVAGNETLLRFDAKTGTPKPGPVSPGVRALAAADGQVIAVQRGSFAVPGSPSVLLAATRSGSAEPKPLDELRAAVVTSLRDVLVADRGIGSILRYSLAGKPDGVFTSAPADRLAVDPEDRVAVLDAREGVIDVVSPDGRSAGRLTRAGKDFDRAVDLAFDGLGYLYVLDRDAGAVRVFEVADRLRPRAVFTVAQKSPGAFRKAAALALDPGGRLYIYDDALERIQVYQ